MNFHQHMRYRTQPAAVALRSSRKWIARYTTAVLSYTYLYNNNNKNGPALPCTSFSFCLSLLASRSGRCGFRRGAPLATNASTTTPMTGDGNETSPPHHKTEKKNKSSYSKLPFSLFIFVFDCFRECTAASLFSLRPVYLHDMPEGFPCRR